MTKYVASDGRVFIGKQGVEKYCIKHRLSYEVQKEEADEPKEKKTAKKKK